MKRPPGFREAFLFCKPMYRSTADIYKKFLECGKVSTDSRTIDKGDLFFALKGPNFNGNEYAQQALDKGASYVVVDEALSDHDDKYLVVEDSLRTLQQSSNYHRGNFDIPFIAIAGSNGKTTTKELIKAVLSTSYETYCSPGNFNNEIGVPLTLLGLKKNTQMAVIEMGAKHRGDIEELCAIVNPTHGLVTNTGKDHLETFITLENTRKANAELYEHLSGNDGVAFVNIADDELLKEAEIVKQEVTYGKDQKADYYGVINKIFPYLGISFNSKNGMVNIQSKLTGKYNFENIMAAIALGKYFQVDDQMIKKAIEAYQPTNNRSQIIKRNSNTFILDAYNANPTSMKEALDNLGEIDAGKKVAILGDMLELGKASEEEHFLIVSQLKKLSLYGIILVGKEFEKVKDEIDCFHFDDVEQARQWFDRQHYENTTFLLKGSRLIQLEKLLD